MNLNLVVHIDCKFFSVQEDGDCRGYVPLLTIDFDGAFDSLPVRIPLVDPLSAKKVVDRTRREQPKLLTKSYTDDVHNLYELEFNDTWIFSIPEVKLDHQSFFMKHVTRKASGMGTLSMSMPPDDSGLLFSIKPVEYDSAGELVHVYEAYAYIPLQLLVKARDSTLLKQQQGMYRGGTFVTDCFVQSPLFACEQQSIGTISVALDCRKSLGGINAALSCLLPPSLELSKKLPNIQHSNKELLDGNISRNGLSLKHGYIWNNYGSLPMRIESVSNSSMIHTNETTSLLTNQRRYRRISETINSNSSPSTKSYGNLEKPWKETEREYDQVYRITSPYGDKEAMESWLKRQFTCFESVFKLKYPGSQSTNWFFDYSKDQLRYPSNCILVGPPKTDIAFLRHMLYYTVKRYMIRNQYLISKHPLSIGKDRARSALSHMVSNEDVCDFFLKATFKEMQDITGDMTAHLAVLLRYRPDKKRERPHGCSVGTEDMEVNALDTGSGDCEEKMFIAQGQYSILAESKQLASIDTSNCIRLDMCLKIVHLISRCYIDLQLLVGASTGDATESNNFMGTDGQGPAPHAVNVLYPIPLFIKQVRVLSEDKVPKDTGRFSSTSAGGDLMNVQKRVEYGPNALNTNVYHAYNESIIRESSFSTGYNTKQSLVALSMALKTEYDQYRTCITLLSQLVGMDEESMFFEVLYVEGTASFPCVSARNPLSAIYEHMSTEMDAVSESYYKKRSTENRNQSPRRDLYRLMREKIYHPIDDPYPFYVFAYKFITNRFITRYGLFIDTFVFSSISGSELSSITENGIVLSRGFHKLVYGAKHNDVLKQNNNVRIIVQPGMKDKEIESLVATSKLQKCQSRFMVREWASEYISNNRFDGLRCLEDFGPEKIFYPSSMNYDPLESKAKQKNMTSKTGSQKAVRLSPVFYSYTKNDWVAYPSIPRLMASCQHKQLGDLLLSLGNDLTSNKVDSLHLNGSVSPSYRPGIGKLVESAAGYARDILAKFEVEYGKERLQRSTSGKHVFRELLYYVSPQSVTRNDFRVMFWSLLVGVRAICWVGFYTELFSETCANLCLSIVIDETEANI